MNQKEISELKRRFRLGKNAMGRIYGCYVNAQKEILSYLDEPLDRMPEEEAEKYLNLLKKASRWRTAMNTAASWPCGIPS